jgi:hypothetical protein
MRSNTEIDAEVAALRKALKSLHWNTTARAAIEQSIQVMEKRMDAAAVERVYYVDETTSDYTEGDNDLYNELARVAAWMAGTAGCKAPSDGL